MVRQSNNKPHPMDQVGRARRRGDPVELELRESAERAVAVRWASFEESHPRLARVLSRPVLARAVEATLMDDDAFHKAMHAAAAQRDAARVLERWVLWVVNRLMKL